MKYATKIIGVLALVLISGCGPSGSSSSSSIQVELRDGLDSTVKITNCGIDGASVKCIMTTSGGTIRYNSLIGKYYDKDGVKLGEYRLPNDDVVPGEKSRTRIASDSNIENVTRVVIGVF